MAGAATKTKNREAQITTHRGSVVSFSALVAITSLYLYIANGCFLTSSEAEYHLLQSITRMEINKALRQFYATVKNGKAT